MLNVGIIGFGKMGKIRGEALEKNIQASIHSVFDNDTSIDFSGYQVSNSPDDIINHPDIDAVFICTPNHLNKTLTIQALSAGKHVFCEKPPAFTAADVEEIRSVEADSGKKLMYGFNHRHHKSIVDMKSLIDSSEFGRVLWMRGRYGKSVDQSFYDNWRSKRDLAGGGIFLDQGIHMLDLFLHLGGNFDEVHAFVSSLYWQIDVEDNVFAIYRDSKTGVVASLHSTMTQWRHLFSLEIFLEKGYMVLNGLKTSSGTYGDEIMAIARNRTTAPAATWEDEEHFTYHTDKSWEDEVNHFIYAVVEDRSIEIGDSYSALQLMRLVDKTYSKGAMNNGS